MTPDEDEVQDEEWREELAWAIVLVSFLVVVGSVAWWYLA